MAFDPHAEIQSRLLKFRGKVRAQGASVGVAGTQMAISGGHAVSRPGTSCVGRSGPQTLDRAQPASRHLKGLQSEKLQKRWKEPHPEYQEANKGQATPVPSPSLPPAGAFGEQEDAAGRREQGKTACLGPRGWGLG